MFSLLTFPGLSSRAGGAVGHLEKVEKEEYQQEFRRQALIFPSSSTGLLSHHLNVLGTLEVAQDMVKSTLH